MSLEDQSRLGEGGSDKTIATVNTIIPTAAADRFRAKVGESGMGIMDVAFARRPACMEREAPS